MDTDVQTTLWAFVLLLSILAVVGRRMMSDHDEEQ